MTTRLALRWISMVTALVACAGGGSLASAAQPDPPGRVVHHESFPSKFVSPRRITVWLPPGYEKGQGRYAVLYMHDGQNLIDITRSLASQPWGVDRVLARLMSDGRIRRTLLVGIDNSATRWRDYAPQEPFEALPERLQGLAKGNLDGAPWSDGYARFIVDELKPFIDAHYRTRTDRANTFLMGSSMGGLISLYTLARYPETFGAAACLSTHWPYTTNPDVLRSADSADATEIGMATIDWLGAHVPAPAAHRLYFDHGTEFLDALYARYQTRVDSLLRARGYADGDNFQSLVFEGATHNEKSWSERLDTPLLFLLRP